MKRPVLFLSLLASALSAVGQTTLTAAANAARDGDSLVMQVVDLPESVIDMKGDNCIWDLPDFEVIFTKPVIFSYIGDTLLSSSDHMTIKSKDVNNISHLLGYENRLLRVEYDKPLPIMAWPFEFGDSVGGSFHGSCQWCDRRMMEVWGVGHTNCDGKGTLILPNGDTLRNVARTRKLRTTYHMDCDGVLTWDELVRHTALQTACRPVVPVPSNAEVSSEVFEWWAPGWRYPVLRVEREWEEGRKRSLAMFCPPSVQRSLSLDEDEAALRLPGRAGDSIAGLFPLQNGFHCEASYNPDTKEIVMRCSAMSEIEIRLFLSDSSGVVWRTDILRLEPGKPLLSRINIGSLHRGQYILRMDSGDKEQTLKFNFK